MDIDIMRSISDDQTDMMMLMNLDKLPDFTGVYSDNKTPISSEFTNLNQPNISYNSIEDINFMNNSSSTTISFTSPTETTLGCHEMQFLSSPRWRKGGEGSDGEIEQKRNSMAAMREMIFRIAAMQPIHIDPESVKPPKRRNVKISKDPQSVAARHRRERISERIRILQRLVPGGTKMDTASMLDEAIHYVKFLKNQVQTLEKAGENRPTVAGGVGFPVPMGTGTAKGYHQQMNVQHYLGA